MPLDIVAQARCFGGTQFVYRHASRETGTPMRLAAFVPPQAERGKVPVVWFLSGLTCTEENFTVKAGAQRVAPYSPDLNAIVVVHHAESQCSNAARSEPSRILVRVCKCS